MPTFSAARMPCAVAFGAPRVELRLLHLDRAFDIRAAIDQLLNQIEPAGVNGVSERRPTALCAVIHIREAHPSRPTGCSVGYSVFCKIARRKRKACGTTSTRSRCPPPCRAPCASRSASATRSAHRSLGHGERAVAYAEEHPVSAPACRAMRAHVGRRCRDHQRVGPRLWRECMFAPRGTNLDAHALRSEGRVGERRKTMKRPNQLCTS